MTVDRAQALGEQFCKEHFPGHQALVCTHPDGHNHSGNIHVHIVINSLRIAEVPLLPYMERPANTREGCKHRCTDAAIEYLKAEVMEMCHRENLYQIDLLNGSRNRITEREYWAKQKGQAALDKENASLAAASAELSSTHARLKAVESTLQEKKDLQKQLLAYIKTKPAREGLGAQKAEKARRAYREQYESDFIISEAAARYFKAHGITKMPASKALQAEVE